MKKNRHLFKGTLWELTPGHTPLPTSWSSESGLFSLLGELTWMKKVELGIEEGSCTNIGREISMKTQIAVCVLFTKTRKTPNRWLHSQIYRRFCVSVYGMCRVGGEENYGDVGNKEIYELELKTSQEIGKQNWNFSGGRTEFLAHGVVFFFFFWCFFGFCICFMISCPTSFSLPFLLSW